MTIDPQTIQSRGPVQCLIAPIQAYFQRLLGDLAAVEKLEQGRGRGVGVFLVVLVQPREVTDHVECGAGQILGVFRADTGGLYFSKATDVVADREGAAVGYAAGVAPRTGAILILVRRQECVYPGANIVSCTYFP